MSFGFLAPALPQIFGTGIDFLQTLGLNRKEEERFDERREIIEPLIGGMRDPLEGLDLDSFSPGADANAAYRSAIAGAGPRADFNLPAFLSGASSLGGSALGALGGAASSAANILGRTGDAVGTAFDEARASLDGGRVEDPLALGMRINELSGLDEMFGEFTPTAALEQAGLASRRAAQQVRQGTGASEMSQGQSERGVAEVAAQAGLLGQQAADNARRLNKSVADSRSGVLSSTAIPQLQMNLQRDVTEAGLGASEAANISQLGGREAELVSGYQANRAGVFQNLIGQLLSGMSQDAQIDAAGRSQDIGIAAKLAELAGLEGNDAVARANLASAGNQTAATQAQLLMALLGNEPDYLLTSFAGLGNNLTSGINTRLAQDKANSGGLF